MLALQGPVKFDGTNAFSLALSFVGKLGPALKLKRRGGGPVRVYQVSLFLLLFLI